MSELHSQTELLESYNRDFSFYKMGTNFNNLPLQYFTLKKILKQLLEDVSQDPEVAHPILGLSENRKSVKFVETGLQHFTFYTCVLATEGFTSGQLCWEVEVGNKTHWALGVCWDSLSRKG